MNNSKTSPASYSYISCGKKDMMYTLRCVEWEVCFVAGENHLSGENRLLPIDSYICNLSTDSAKAEAKAIHLSEQMGLDFRGSADFELEDIRRRKAEMDAEMVAAEREASENAARQRELQIKAEYDGWMDDGIILIGKYQGMPIADVAASDIMYVRWLATNTTATGKLGASANIAKNWLIANDKLETAFVGSVGETITITNATLVQVRYINGMYPTFMHTVIDQDDNTLIFYSTAKCWKELELGATVSFTGLVKEHRKGWDGVNQTIINKPKMVKVK